MEMDRVAGPPGSMTPLREEEVDLTWCAVDGSSAHAQDGTAPAACTMLLRLLREEVVLVLNPPGVLQLPCKKRGRRRRSIAPCKVLATAALTETTVNQIPAGCWHAAAIHQ